MPKEDVRYSVYQEYGVGNMGIRTTIETLKKANAAKKTGKAHGAYEGGMGLRVQLILWWMREVR
ncbi:hypothetical protein ACFL0D_06680 [Thermoproteota archaeon]